MEDSEEGKKSTSKSKITSNNSRKDQMSQTDISICSLSNDIGVQSHWHHKHKKCKVKGLEQRKKRIPIVMEENNQMNLQPRRNAASKASHFMRVQQLFGIQFLKLQKFKSNATKTTRSRWSRQLWPGAKSAMPSFYQSRDNHSSTNPHPYQIPGRTCLVPQLCTNSIFYIPYAYLDRTTNCAYVTLDL